MKLLCIGVLAALMTATPAETIRMVGFQLEPYMMEDTVTGTLSGVTVDYWRDFIAPEIGVTIEVLGVMPVSRAIKMLESGEADVIPLLTRIAKRENLFYFSDSPFTMISSGLMVPAGSSILEVSEQSDLFGLTVGFLEDAYLPDLLNHELITIELVSNLDYRNIHLNKMRVGRLDAILDINLISLKYYLQNRADRFLVRIIPLPVPDAPVYAVFRKTAEGKALCDRFSKANTKGIELNIVDTIVKKYVDAER
ncbi:MAG: transporter substrate-binding domain-containing protein [Spirochaetales bacterium]|nr:transporter substrate-binding domain-containing protein [Spirochaetales bacterium]